MDGFIILKDHSGFWVEGGLFWGDHCGSRETGWEAVGAGKGGKVAMSSTRVKTGVSGEK